MEGDRLALRPGAALCGDSALVLWDLRSRPLLDAGIVVILVTWGDITSGVMATIVRVARMLERFGGRDP